MADKFTIYFLADAVRPRRPMYVGQTGLGLETRLDRHYRSAMQCHDLLPRNKWIRRVFQTGSGLVIQGIDTARSKREADEKEEKWIKLHWDRGLMNVAPRACGVARHTVATRKKMALRKKGKKLAERHCRRIAAALKRSWKDPNVIESRRLSMLGHPVSREAKENMSRAAMGRIISKAQRRKAAIAIHNWFQLHPQTNERKYQVSLACRKAWSDPRLKAEQSARVIARHKDPIYAKKFSAAVKRAWKLRKEVSN